MTISDGDHRLFGKTGLSTPPIWFRADVMDNAARVIPDQSKRVICGEWFQRVMRQVFIEVPHDVKRHAGLELGRTLRRLDISSDDVVINLGMNCAADLRSKKRRDAIHSSYDKACKSLGEAYSPQLVSLDAPDEHLTSATSHADHANGSKDMLDAIDILAELKAAKRIAGVGMCCKNWRIAKDVCDVTELDFIILLGSYTIMRQPPELVEFLTSLAERQIAVIAAGVFHGGFLVGGPRFDGRVVSPDDSANQSLYAWRKAFTSLCHGHGARPAQACIQFALSAPGIVAVSMSTSHAERVAENVDSVVNHIPAGLWASMKEEGLLEDGYAQIG